MTASKNLGRIASHRGGTLEYGDSTPRGFRATAQMPLEEVEFDVHPTRDGAVMVHHDATLDRTTDRSGAIAELTEAEVRAATINYGGGGNPISLAELCAIFRPSRVDLRCEIKPGADGLPYPGFVPQVVDILAREGMLERTTFTSFLVQSLDELAQASDRHRLWLVSPQVLKQLSVPVVIDLAKRHAVPELGIEINTLNASIRDAIVDAGLAFGCWAAHSTAQLEKAFGLGVKVLTTDRPSLAIAVRARLAAERGQ